VRQLDERERELIGLRYGADLTSKQIAEVLELSPEAVRVALHRALVRLRGLLDEEPTGVDTRSGRSCAPRFSDL
jgi:RNA polymerase sigma-70 factor (ECF subfamily)